MREAATGKDGAIMACMCAALLALTLRWPEAEAADLFVRNVSGYTLAADGQLTHATSDKNMAEDRIGAERLKGAYAWRTFLDQGTVIAGGSDFPVESVNPFFGIHAAVTRQDHDDRPPGGWHAEQKMTLLEAFRAFTLDAAYAAHAEKSRGSLEPDKWADFILVERDIFTSAPQQIWLTRVLQTWVGGRQLYAASAARSQPGG